MAHRLPGLRALLPSFDAFLVDLWGVVHDGDQPFEGVVATLEALAAGGHPVLFVTNTSRLADAVARTLEGMGIGRALYTDIVTAGDVTRQALATRDAAVFAGLPSAPRCFHFGDPDFVPWLFELGLAFTDDAAAADLVLATGTVPNDRALRELGDRLGPLAARGAPLVCTNPDRLIPTARGAKLGPGAVARHYAERGGRVFLYGKPHAAIYEEARRRLGGASRILALGDMLETDVRGAQGAGHASALVLGGGLHAPDAPHLDALFAREAITPTFVLDRFRL